MNPFYSRTTGTFSITGAPFLMSTLALHSLTVTKCRSCMSAVMSAWCSSGTSWSSSGVPLLDFVRKYRMAPAPPLSFDDAGALRCAALLAVLRVYSRAPGAPGWAWARMRVSVQIPGDPAPLRALLLGFPIVLLLSIRRSGDSLAYKLTSRRRRPLPWRFTLCYQASPLAGVPVAGGPGEIRIFPTARDRRQLLLGPSMSTLDCSNPLSFSPTI